MAELSNSQILNYANISNDAQAASSTVQEYFQILRDTLICNDLSARGKSLKGVRALKEEQLLKHYCVIYTGEQKRINEDNIPIYALRQFLTNLWDGAFSS